MSSSRLPRAPIFAVIVGALLVFAAAIAIGSFLDADSGSYADWLAALATLAAFGAAVLAAWYAAGAFRLETQRDQRWGEAQRSAQASKVAVWSGSDRTPIEKVGIRTFGGQFRQGVFIRNSSDLPVLGCTVAIVVGYDDDDVGSFVPLTRDSQMLGVAPPASEPKFFPFKPEVQQHFDGLDLTKVSVELVFSFYDAAGIEWIRDDDGRLTEVVPLASPDTL